MKLSLSETCFMHFIEFLDKHEIDLVEVSDGSYDIDHNKKLEYISRLAEKVYSYFRGRIQKERCCIILLMNGFQ